MAEKLFYQTKRFWIGAVAVVVGLPVIITIAAIGLVYAKQDKIVQTALADVNKTLPGEIALQRFHLEIFKTFPQITIDLENVNVYENKSKDSSKTVLHLGDVFVGFDLWKLISGRHEINYIHLTNGQIDVIRHADSTLNVYNAFGIDPNKPDTDTSASSVSLKLDNFVLENVLVHSFDETKKSGADINIQNGKLKFGTRNNKLFADIETKFLVTVVQNGKPTMFKEKAFALDTRFQYNKDKQRIHISRSKFQFEQVDLTIDGSAEFAGDQNIDLKISGERDNFDLLIAFAPGDIVPILKQYGNSGKIHADATIKGSTKNGQMPAINATFSVGNGYFKNKQNAKTLNEIEMNGTFTNGDAHTLESMVLTLNNLSAKPEAGLFKAKLRVENFVSPNIDLNLISDFNLDFLVKFLNMDKDLRNARGNVRLTMNFHDIINLEHPELALEKLNKSYFTELRVKDLSFEVKQFPFPFRDININADMKGENLDIAQFTGKVGNSDISVTGTLADLPAVIHQSAQNISSHLHIKSQLLDLNQLTYSDSLKRGTVDEQVKNLNLQVAFACKANAFATMKNLPAGEFKLENLRMNLQKYAHTFSNIKGVFFIEKNDIAVKHFKGNIDSSDFSFSGRLTNYEALLNSMSDTVSAFSAFFKSNNIYLNDLLSDSVKKELHENIFNEQIANLKFKAKGVVDFENKTFKGIKMDLKELDMNLPRHKHLLENFSGKIIFWKEHFALKDFQGCIGKSDFKISCFYNLSKSDSLKKRSNYFTLQSYYLNLNELLAFEDEYSDNDSVAQAANAKADSVTAFTVGSVPFMNFKVNATVGLLKYRTYRLKNVVAAAQMSKSKTIQIDSLNFKMNKAKFVIKGKLNASDTNNIVLIPRISVQNLDLEKTLLRFGNFGQDYILSDNLSGTLSAKLHGHLVFDHAFGLKLPKSHLVLDVRIVDGILKKYQPLQRLSDFLGDKNLNRVAFDTLQNNFEFKDNKLNVPNMSINSTIGFMQVSGTQDTAMNMEYYIKIPLKLITDIAANKLFRKKKEEIDPNQVDEIERGSDNTHYINVKVSGTPENMNVSLGKKAKK